eukprot:TRINITY_DN1440_c0_g2_i1.p1 TRINITY_DN1440_c0_g2~~TRINITY_DN1440_c0_g2_i1.p1  ORF type:complete len:222 (-),score=34.45 TRINITY_DN1440_c0_g2_i1:69-734(-)
MQSRPQAHRFLVRPDPFAYNEAEQDLSIIKTKQFLTKNKTSVQKRLVELRKEDEGIKQSMEDIEEFPEESTEISPLTCDFNTKEVNNSIHFNIKRKLLSMDTDEATNKRQKSDQSERSIPPDAWRKASPSKPKKNPESSLTPDRFRATVQFPSPNNKIICPTPPNSPAKQLSLATERELSKLRIHSQKKFQNFHDHVSKELTSYKKIQKPTKTVLDDGNTT